MYRCGRGNNHESVPMKKINLGKKINVRFKKMEKKNFNYGKYFTVNKESIYSYFFYSNYMSPNFFKNIFLIGEKSNN